MKLSTATSVYVNYLLEDAVEECAGLELAGLDIWCGRPHLYRRDYQEEVLARIKAKLDANKVRVVSLMPAFYRYPHSLSNPLSTVREDSISYMRDCIDNACTMGANHVLIVPSPLLHGQTEAEARRLFLLSMEHVLEYAQPRGMRLGVEVLNPHLSGYMCYVNQATELIRSLAAPALLGIVLDTGHLNLSGEGFARALDMAGDSLYQIHINDNDGREQQNSIPGKGTFAFEDMCRELEVRKYQGFLSFELGGQYAGEPSAALSAGIRYMQQILGA
jgi:sugar phosphate isomerase/epimerase